MHVDWKKFFLLVGVPALAFYFFLVTTFFAFIAGLLAVFFLVGLACVRFRDGRFWKSASKLSIAMLACFTLMISNPIIWPQQIARHLDPALIVTPQAPEVEALNGSGGLWAWLEREEGLNASEFDALDEPTKLNHISDYVLDDVVTWTPIQEQYGVLDRLATPAEAITSHRGDCQAQTVVTVSLLIYLGYNAYACETPFHWYTVVFLANGTPVYLYRVINDGFRCSDPEILINHEGVLYTMNWAELLVDVVMSPHFNNSLNGFFQEPGNWPWFVPLLLGLGLFLTAVIKETELASWSHFLKLGLASGGAIVAGFATWTTLSTIWMSITAPLLLVTVLVAVRLIENDFFGKFGRE
ncbi:MAG: hypothetical protein ACTSU5_03205 [Promethearchaeota archaeon]